MSKNAPIHSITILTTNTCTAACAHCCMNSGPKRRGKLDADSIISTLAGLVEHGSLNTVVFAGGEPTLLKEDLLTAISAASDMGLNTRIVTNASWATTPEKAREKLSQLRAAGLRELNISADDYHLPFIAFDRVKTLWFAAKEFDFSSVLIANCAGPNSVITPEWIKNELGEDLPTRFDDDGNSQISDTVEGKTFYGLSNANIQRVRYGFEEDVQSWEVGDADLNRPCPYAGRSISMSPDGHLLACCGFEFDADSPLRFGSVEEQPVDEIISAAYDGVILNAIASIGPFGVMKVVQSVAPEVPFRDDYNSICEICFDVTQRPDARKALMRATPILARFFIDQQVAAE
ncbi:radical SAM/SPASM domain-containing protein [Phaeobacter sp. B1627]|uniref:radical SAM protein n=1 Tax=Phaeobacter sp. B1627 TaxID=2583809 RepID=UPI00111A018D|nr:radical SAM/SPASM domain-containing protein [Phaeobacter sp. B1627]TNJ40808.1 radical SAM protein [Phaeobacter sp. B1627]